jgi:hypothetical protein
MKELKHTAVCVISPHRKVLTIGVCTLILRVINNHDVVDQKTLYAKTVAKPLAPTYAIITTWSLLQTH